SVVPCQKDCKQCHHTCESQINHGHLIHYSPSDTVFSLICSLIVENGIVYSGCVTSRISFESKSEGVVPSIAPIPAASSSACCVARAVASSSLFPLAETEA